MKLSQRITQIKPSAAVELDRVLAQMRENGEQIISLNAGQPDFATPSNIIKACNEALNQGKTKYVSINGIIELRKAICEKLKKDNNVVYNPQEIVVTTGAKQALYNAMQVLVNPGDEVIIPTPCWVSYKEMVKLAQGVPVLVPAKADYHLDLDIIEESVSSKTKAIIINTPNNPTGVVYTQQELEKLAELAVKHDLFIISDEVYEKLIYDGCKHFCIASISEEVKKHCVVVNGFSKAYAMTGWRLGYLAASEEIALAVCSIQGHTTSNSTTFVQWAGVEALQGDQSSVFNMKNEFEKRRDYMYERLTSIKGISCVKPQGAFYMLADVSSYFNDKIKDENDLCAYLLKEAKLAILPGSAFDAPGCVRISYSNSQDNIKLGIDVLEQSLYTL